MQSHTPRSRPSVLNIENVCLDTLVDQAKLLHTATHTTDVELGWSSIENLQI